MTNNNQVAKAMKDKGQRIYEIIRYEKKFIVATTEDEAWEREDDRKYTVYQYDDAEITDSQSFKEWRELWGRPNSEPVKGLDRVLKLQAEA